MRSTRRTLHVLFALFLAAPLAALGQAPVAQLLERATELSSQAREAYQIHTPDQRLWRDALSLFEEALRQVPDDLEVLRASARAYADVNWHARAFELWNRYLELGGELTGEVRESFTGAGTALGYSRYRSGNATGALVYYEAVLNHFPDDEEALYWLGVIRLELGDNEAARGHFERLLDLNPDHQTAAYYLSLIEEIAQIGPQASGAFRAGLSAYEQGSHGEALEQFAQALQFNGDFAEAAVWAGRTALEMGDPLTALPYWERAVELRPDDGGSRYFLNLTRQQLQWGVQAGTAFSEGLALYSQGRLDEAAQAFAQAAQANPENLGAWEWAARTLQEAGRPGEAVDYWEGLLERAPEDQSAQFNLQLARQQQGAGSQAGAVFAQAVQAYQLAQLDRAQELFEEAARLNPQFAPVWGWLGQLHFADGEYDQAAQAYERALQLEPQNDDYAFFAEEARFLAGEE